MSDLDQLTQSPARNLKRWRGERGFTLDTLAARAGVSRGMIIQIEQARTNPSVGTTVKPADALEVGITTLLDHEPVSPVRLVPGDRAVRMWSTPAGSSAVLRVGTEARGPLELWTWRLMPGDSRTSDPHPEGAVELLHVTAAELTLVVDGTPCAVPAGVSATFEAHHAHTYRNDGIEPAEATMAVSIPPAR
ncbi:helix-turn-helix domain-containing protein [Streptomyces sp. NPDC001750]|uniref:helix-turn-helix domain-containing protein n=1 Tax=Streptomyces sp. NPDC001750 TaxID=3364607 RepID=UPI00367AF0C3